MKKVLKIACSISTGLAAGIIAFYPLATIVVSTIVLNPQFWGNPFLEIMTPVIGITFGLSMGILCIRRDDWWFGSIISVSLALLNAAGISTSAEVDQSLILLAWILVSITVVSFMGLGYAHKEPCPS